MDYDFKKMTAIEFMKTWKDICSHHSICKDCDLYDTCLMRKTSFWVYNYTDETIIELIAAINQVRRSQDEV